MSNPRFLEIHSLHAYNGVLLNRDENGYAKRMTFGNAVRIRISSQCLKRHWRTYDGPMCLHSIPGATAAIRSRETVQQMVIGPLRESGDYQEDVLDTLQEAFHKGVYGPSGVERERRQPLLLGVPEIDHLKNRAKMIADAHPKDPEAATEAATNLFNPKTEEGSNFQAMLRAIKYREGLENAMFGRMVTSDFDSNTEGSVNVAHSFTVHEQEQEADYFTVVDDLMNRNEGAAAAHLNESEITSGIFYNYVVVDLPTLVSNLEGGPAANWLEADREFTSQVVERLIHTIAKVTPGAKVGSTAPYSYADFVAVEVTEHQPRALSNAFRKPVNSAQMEDAVTAIGAQASKLDELYGNNRERRFMASVDAGFPGERCQSLDELARWAAANVLLPAQE